MASQLDGWANLPNHIVQRLSLCRKPGLQQKEPVAPQLSPALMIYDISFINLTFYLSAN